MKGWVCIGLLVLTMVLAACGSSTPPTPSLQDIAQATAIAQKSKDDAGIAAAQAASVKSESEAKAKLSAAQAAAVDQQRKNDQDLTATKIAAEKALSDATVDGQRRRDIVAANTAALESYSAAYKSRTDDNLRVLQEDLNRQSSEGVSYSFLNLWANLKPWLVAVLVALVVEFVISLGQWWYARIYAGQPRWIRKAGAFDFLGAWLWKRPYSELFEAVPGIVLGWITEWIPRPPPGMWQTRAIHPPEIEGQVARLAAGSKLIQNALQSARGIPGAAGAIESLGRSAVEMTASGVGVGEACEHGRKGYCPIPGCSHNVKK